MIKHLVISGGGPSGLYSYGALKFLSKSNFWDIKNIKTMYGTSIGAFLSVILSLKYDWDVIDEYIIKKPWSKLINISPEMVLNLWDMKGLFGDEVIIDALKPLLAAKELNIDITLKELYDFNKIEIHMFSININSMPLSITDVSYKTFPELSLIKAIAMTSAIPLIFKPVLLDNKCFIDGGFLTNFPLDICLENTGCLSSEVLACKNYWSINDVLNSFNVNLETNVLQFWNYLMKIFLNQLKSDKNHKNIDNIINCLIDECSDLNEWKDVLLNRELRMKFIKKGEQSGFLFLKYKSKNEEAIGSLFEFASESKAETKAESKVETKAETIMISELKSYEEFL